jgi:polyhydroxyalkanoate synthesis regulator phasin
MANYIAINVNQDLTHVTEQIQCLIDLLQQQGKSPEEAQEKVAQDIATQAQNDPTAKEKLVKWGESIGTATVTDVVKGAVKLAIRLAGIPIP